MNILLFNGSPKNGFSAKFCSHIVKNYENVVLVDSYQENVKACFDCGYCNKHVCKCIYSDMNVIYDHIANADIIIAVSPIHVGSISAPLLAMFSRLQIYFANKFIHKNEFPFKAKVGFGIAIGGSDWDGQKEALHTVFKHSFLEMNSSLNYYYVNKSEFKNDGELSNDFEVIYKEIDKYVKNI